MTKQNKGFDPQKFLAKPAREEVFRVRLESTQNGLLMSGVESLDQIKPAGKRKKSEDTPAEKPDPQTIAASQIYRNQQGKPCLRKINLLACLREAGKEIPWGAVSKKKKVTDRKGRTILFSFLSIIGDSDLDLELPATGPTNEGWVIDSRKAYDKKTKQKVTVYRPLFPGWALEFDLVVKFIGPEVTEKMVKDLLISAGYSQGLGAFRRGLTPPGRDYTFPFGTFRVTEFKKITTATGQSKTG